LKFANKTNQKTHSVQTHSLSLNKIWHNNYLNLRKLDLCSFWYVL